MVAGLSAVVGLLVGVVLICVGLKACGFGSTARRAAQSPQAFYDEEGPTLLAGGVGGGGSRKVRHASLDKDRSPVVELQTVSFGARASDVAHENAGAALLDEGMVQSDADREAAALLARLQALAASDDGAAAAEAPQPEAAAPPRPPRRAPRRPTSPRC